MYDPRNDLDFDVIKAFHQALIDDRYPPADMRYFVKNMLPGLMRELERLKGETRRLEAEVEGLRRETEGEGSEHSESSEG